MSNAPQISNLYEMFAGSEPVKVGEIAADVLAYSAEGAFVLEHQSSNGPSDHVMFTPDEVVRLRDAIDAYLADNPPVSPAH